MHKNEYGVIDVNLLGKFQNCSKDVICDFNMNSFRNNKIRMLIYAQETHRNKPQVYQSGTENIDREILNEIS